MAHQADLVDALRSLSISDAPPEWTAEVWEHNFCDGVSLPAEVERKCLMNEANWARLVSATRSWLELETSRQAENEESEFSWILLKAQCLIVTLEINNV